MASEDSQALNAWMSSSSVRRRLPPRFIGALRLRISSIPAGDKCRPDRTSSVMTRKTARSHRFGLRNGKRSKNGNTRSNEVSRTGHFEIVNPIPAVTHRSDVEGHTEELWELTSDLRHVERQRNAPRQATITLSTDWDVEASLSIDEPGDPIA